MIYWVLFASGITGCVGYVIGRSAGVRACRTRHEHDWGDWSLSACGRFGEMRNIRRCESCGFTETCGI